MAALNKEFDVVIVGGGVMGMSTAWYATVHLKRRVLLVEKFSLFHNHGSSHGNSRNFRSIYSDPEQSQFMPEAYRLWRQLEIESNRVNQLLISSGKLDVFRSEQDLARNVCNLTANRIQHFVLTTHQIAQKFPFMNCITTKADKELSDATRYIFEPSGGVLIADQCNRAFYEMAVATGAKFLENCEVVSIERNPESDKVALVKAVPNSAINSSVQEICCFKANSIVLTPGSWSKTPPLLKTLLDKYEIPLKTLRTGYSYYAAKPEAKHPISSYPVYYDNKVYSCAAPNPACSNLSEMHYKAGYHAEYHDPNSDVVDPSAAAATPLSKHNIDCANAYIAANFPELDANPVSTVECIYSALPDDRFVLDRIKIDSLSNQIPVVLATGFCGAGFKLAPVIGKLASEMVVFPEEELKRIIKYNLECFKADRFAHKHLERRFLARI